MTEPSAAVLKVENISKSYGKLTALDQVNFMLEPGFYALLGPNGAGKSTLFQLLSGLFQADQGEIIINGQNIRSNLTQALATMGVVFQQSSLDLDLTVQANLNFYGRLHGMSSARIRQRSAEELEHIGLADVAQKRCRELSGGNRRKVELARALLNEPKLLLMDEATVGLDPSSRDLLLQYVQRMCGERRMCVLWATHLIDEAEIARRVLVLHKGRLLANQPPGTLVSDSGEADLLHAFLRLSGQTLRSEQAL